MNCTAHIISSEALESALFRSAEFRYGGHRPMKYKQLKRMSDTQYHSAKSLIQNICSNYDKPTGGCIRLDCGEIVPCPQMITKSLCCKHFRDVLLEDSRGRDLKTAIMGEDYIKECAECHRPFRAVSNRAKYCKRCAEKVRKRQTTARVRKHRKINEVFQLDNKQG